MSQLDRDGVQAIIRKVLRRGSTVSNARTLYSNVLQKARGNGDTVERDTFDGALGEMLRDGTLVVFSNQRIKREK